MIHTQIYLFDMTMVVIHVVQVSNTEHHMIRQDKGAGVIDIRHTINSTDVRDRWLLVRKQLDNASRVSVHHVCVCIYVLY